MNGYTDELDSLLDGFEYEDFDERVARRRPTAVRTPSRQSSFTSRQAPTAASQGQVQAAARNLDAKIETLGNAVKTLESRTNGLAAEQERTTALLRKEATDRTKGVDATRAELQQTRMLALLLPLISQQAVEVPAEDGRTVKVVTQSQDQLSTLLPLLLLLPGLSGGDTGKPMDLTPILLITALRK
ncbi:hypothetical protein [Phytohabitans aurantiacus]|uniref:Uncharacterized protein n=1 Tax=Phytohabitans aurantiacus TaxID=3016789 RepID=A0ABQ5R546_9ACTN|nr:hypothetical protein [Phytohabitans aurantiacus]GLI01055.1 hypothetical protein Pa4123_63310 [Phytohabitans aurantiacus]